MRTRRFAKLMWIVSVGDSFAIKDAIINAKSNLKSAANNRKELNPANKGFLVKDVERSYWKKVSERVPSVHSLSGSLIWASA